ncbi:hypothetical protein V8F20_002416 [Naviculisporaceae sp. PSN 640]
MASNESLPPGLVKEKKSLFKRTVPRKKLGEQKSPEVSNDAERQDETNDLDFFSRAKDVFPMVLQEVLEKEKSPSPERHDRKRRKLSTEPEAATLTRTSSPMTSSMPEGRKSSSFVGLDSDSDSDVIMGIKGKGKEIVKPSRPATPKKPGSETFKRSPKIIEVDDEEPQAPPSRPNRTERVTRASSRLRDRDSSPVPVVDLDYKVEPAAGDSPDLEEIPPASDEDPIDEELNAWVAKAKQRQAAANSEVAIPLLITSRIEGTKSLVFMRRLKQDFQLALVSWICQQRNNDFAISEEEASRMFLTWKGHKIYGHSPLSSLGIEVDDRGKVKGFGPGFKRGGIHLEAWTEEEYALYLKQEQASRLELVDGDQQLSAELEEEYPPPSPEKKGIRVTLKAKAFESLNLMAHDDTTVATVIEAFRHQRGVGPGRKVEIWLDGERLDEGSFVKDADVDPDETNQLEVHVK